MNNSNLPHVVPSTYFDCKVSYSKVVDNGLTKKVTESYFVSALSFSEAEKRLAAYLAAYGDYFIKTIARSKVNEVVTSLKEADDTFFLAVISLITLDERTGKEKKTKRPILVQSSDIGSARQVVIQYMSDSVSDYSIHSLKETSVEDVIWENKKSLLQK